jgi:hypothetical protein
MAMAVWNSATPSTTGAEHSPSVATTCTLMVLAENNFSLQLHSMVAKPFPT